MASEYANIALPTNVRMIDSGKNRATKCNSQLAHNASLL
jgi:hypothetical protein